MMRASAACITFFMGELYEDDADAFADPAWQCSHHHEFPNEAESCARQELARRESA